jgi:hypothetical protein
MLAATYFEEIRHANLGTVAVEKNLWALFRTQGRRGQDCRPTMSGGRLVLGYWSEGLQRDVGRVGINISASSVILSERERRRFSIIMARIRTTLQKSARFSLETNFDVALYQRKKNFGSRGRFGGDFTERGATQIQQSRDRIVGDHSGS